MLGAMIGKLTHIFVDLMNPVLAASKQRTVIYACDLVNYMSLASCWGIWQAESAFIREVQPFLKTDSNSECKMPL